MNTPRNSNGLYDAPIFPAASEQLALTQTDLEAQLKEGGFVMDRDEAINSGLINPYDDETAKVLVR